MSNDIAIFLQAYGGWGVAVILGIAFVKFYKDFKSTVKEKDDKLEQLNEAHYKEMIEVVRECTQCLTSVSSEMETFNRNQGKKDASSD